MGLPLIVKARVWIVVVVDWVVEGTALVLGLIPDRPFLTVGLVMASSRPSTGNHDKREKYRQPERDIGQHTGAVSLTASNAALAAPGAHPRASSQPCARRSRRAQLRQVRPIVRPRRSAKVVCAAVFMVATSCSSCRVAVIPVRVAIETCAVLQPRPTPCPLRASRPCLRPPAPPNRPAGCRVPASSRRRHTGRTCCPPIARSARR